MNIKEWINDLIGDDSYRTAAKKIDTTGSTITRQLDKGRLTPTMVIDLCRAYDRSPVAGLIETGYLNKWETHGVSIPFALEKATNRQLLDEIQRRSDLDAQELFTRSTETDTTPEN